MLRYLLAFIVVIIVVSVPSSAQAHRPIFAYEQPTSLEDPVEIIDPEVSWAIYSKLQTDEADYYRFEVPPDSSDFFAQIIIPKREEFFNFDPSFALIGANLSDDGPVPFEMPSEWGILLAPASDVQETFFEPFTQTSYLMRQEINRKLKEGIYYLVVYHTDNREGKYTLTVGEREVWEWRDLFRFPLIWMKVRMWYDPIQTVAIIVLVPVMIGGIIVLTTRRNRQ